MNDQIGALRNAVQSRLDALSTVLAHFAQLEIPSDGEQLCIVRSMLDELKWVLGIIPNGGKTLEEKMRESGRFQLPLDGESTNKQILRVTFQGKQERAEAISFAASEAWSNLTLENGTTIKLKTVVSRILRILDRTKDDGSPFYVVEGSVVSSTILPSDEPTRFNPDRAVSPALT